MAAVLTYIKIGKTVDLQVLILNVSTASFISNPLEHSGERGRSLKPGDSLESFPNVFWFNISEGSSSN